MTRVLREQGLSLVEASIVLMVVSILTAVAAPSASRLLDRARFDRAVEDTNAIKTALVAWDDDLGSYGGFNVDGGSSSSDPVEMAVTDGDTPIEVSFEGDERWIHPVSSPTPDPGFLIVDFFENHMALNNPFGGAATDAYPLGGGNTWRGAYMNSPFDPDPWGNRYASNIAWLQAPGDTRNDVIVLSAGPDEQIDTGFEVDGTVPGDDDVIAVVARDRNTYLP